MLRRMSLVSLLALPLIAFTPPAAAQLNAFFSGNTTRACVQAAAGFDANLVLLGPAQITSTMIALQLFLNPDGTGSISESILNIGHNATGTGATPAVESTATCSLTYTFDAAASLVKTTSFTCDSTALNGPGAGQVTRVTDIHGEWLLLERGTKLVRVWTGPNVEHVTNLATAATAQRICHREGMFIFRGPAQGN
jgi:hypothetical protein